MSFYQKYRPQKIEELDLNVAREMLLGIMNSGKMSHAFLFVGPRGSGKTSAARIVARVINCDKNKNSAKLEEPCGVCESCVSMASPGCVDILEIDAASAGLVDDIRDLREKARLAPASLSKKVYIIDEVHMVSSAGFNALLKTLEEPPSHAVFILCTTEANKVPDTIISRCVRINFDKAGEDEILRSLQKAVSGESLEVEDGALRAIARATDGSFREGHKLLEQIASFGQKITEVIVTKFLGSMSSQNVGDLLMKVYRLDKQAVVELFSDYEKMAVKPAILLHQLLLRIREEIEKEKLSLSDFNKRLHLIDLLISSSDQLRTSPIPMLPLEIALLKFMQSDKNVGEEGETENTNRESEVHANSTDNEGLNQSQKTEELSNKEQEKYDGPLASFEMIKSQWFDFVQSMAGSCGSLAGMLRMVSPVEFNGRSVTLEVSSRFQLEMLEREVKKKIIEEQMNKKWGPITFKCVLNDRIETRTVPDLSDVNIEKVGDGKSETVGVAEVAEKIFGG